MARSSNQKRKILYLLRILYEKTDENHPLTMRQIIEQLDGYGVSAERKCLYDDLEELRLFGADIVGDRGKYYLGSRTFELPELKLLVDAVQSSRFITKRKSAALIRKMQHLCSAAEACELKRNVQIRNRVKTMNEQIYYNVDALHTAILSEKQVSFQYAEWAVDREEGCRLTRRLRRDGHLYQISPWTLIWDDENYYLVGCDEEKDEVHHYRVDKMQRISVLDKARPKDARFLAFDEAEYSKEVFGMFGGEPCQVRLYLPDRLIGVVADRFGEEIRLHPQDENGVAVDLPVRLSPQFLAWVFALGDEVKILSPQCAAEAFANAVHRIGKRYPEKERGV